ncbi:MAG TPA: nitroreductase family deazaflavin-dependent oxidoreductase [Blastocatellia bacterium]|nr:nitroreductase family deazaflavin-dependent oxidoreductase [Blastocatellia bacterium]
MPTTKATQNQYLYLTTTGRTTGLPREIEIWFVKRNDLFYILAERFHDAHWVRNIEAQPVVDCRIGDLSFRATARILDEHRDESLWKEIQQLALEKHGWGDGLPVQIIPDQS